MEDVTTSSIGGSVNSIKTICYCYPGDGYETLSFESQSDVFISDLDSQENTDSLINKDENQEEQAKTKKCSSHPPIYEKKIQPRYQISTFLKITINKETDEKNGEEDFEISEDNDLVLGNFPPKWGD